MIRKIERTLLFLVLLFLPTQLGLHFWPKFSYIYSIRIDYLSPVVYFWDILVLALLFIWFLGKRHLNRLAFNLLLLFILSIGASLIFSNNVVAGIVRLEQYLVAGLFGLYLASQKISELNSLLSKPLIIGIAVESVISIGQFLLGKTLGFWILGERTFNISTPGISKFDFYGIQFLRPYGTFPHPNVLAAYLLIVCLIIFLVKSSKIRFNALAYILSFVVVVLSISRSVIVVAVSLVFLMIRGKKLWFFCLLILLISPILYVRYASLVGVDNLTLIRREQLAESAIKIFWHSPIFGIGINNFIPFASSQLIAGPSRFLQPVHNIFLLSLAETGIVGTLGFLIFIGVPMYLLFKFRSFINNWKEYMYIWIIIIFLGIFDHFFLTLPQGYRLLFMVWGLSLALVSKEIRR